jgi:hypothetical protein
VSLLFPSFLFFLFFSSGGKGALKLQTKLGCGKINGPAHSAGGANLSISTGRGDEQAGQRETRNL